MDFSGVSLWKWRTRSSLGIEQSFGFSQQIQTSVFPDQKKKVCLKLNVSVESDDSLLTFVLRFEKFKSQNTKVFYTV